MHDHVVLQNEFWFPQCFSILFFLLFLLNFYLLIVNWNRNKWTTCMIKKKWRVKREERILCRWVDHRNIQYYFIGFDKLQTNYNYTLLPICPFAGCLDAFMLSLVDSIVFSVQLNVVRTKYLKLFSIEEEKKKKTKNTISIM